MTKRDMAPDDKMDEVFKECSALLAMAEPNGSVSVQDYKRVLSLAKQYRKWCHECLDGQVIDGYIRVPRLKTQAALWLEKISSLIDKNEIEEAHKELERVAPKFDPSNTEIVRLRSLIRFIQDDCN